MMLQGHKRFEIDKKTSILARPLKHYRTGIDQKIRKWVEDTMGALEDDA